MEQTEAQAQLTHAVAKYKAAEASLAQARDRLRDVIRQVTPRPLRQVDIVNATGWTREYIRQITKGEAGAAGTDD